MKPSGKRVQEHWYRWFYEHCAANSKIDLWCCFWLIYLNSSASLPGAGEPVRAGQQLGFFSFFSFKGLKQASQQSIGFIWTRITAGGLLQASNWAFKRYKWRTGLIRTGGCARGTNTLFPLQVLLSPLISKCFSELVHIRFLQLLQMNRGHKTNLK